MKRINILITLGFIAMVCIAFDSSNSNHLLSTGAPPAHTGAPGEPSCAKSGCHDGSIENSGIGLLTLNYNDDISEYLPGETYQVKIALEEVSITRFGFELTVISDVTGDEAGSILVTDSSRMQLVQGPAPQENRTYITYKYAGTNPVALGKGEWIFDWTAPQTDIGPVSFYLAAVSANDDASDDGDLTYTTSLKVLPGTVSGLGGEHLITSVSVYPNPATDQVFVDPKKDGSYRLSVRNLQGQEVAQETFREQVMIEIAHLPRGIYIFTVQDMNGEDVIVKKVTVQ